MFLDENPSAIYIFYLILLEKPKTLVYRRLLINIALTPSITKRKKEDKKLKSCDLVRKY